jgi:hypothetical protein
MLYFSIGIVHPTKMCSRILAQSSTPLPPSALLSVLLSIPRTSCSSEGVLEFTKAASLTSRLRHEDGTADGVNVSLGVYSSCAQVASHPQNDHGEEQLRGGAGIACN